MESSNAMSKTSGLKFKDYASYAMGDFGSLLAFSLVTSLLQRFYTDIFMINPLWIMIMMIVARLWDAVNDPIMGRIVDRTKINKHGRYKSWMMGSSFPLAIFAILMFVKWPGMGADGNEIGTFIYATATYILFGMAYTATNIPYGGLAGVVTTDEDERNKLSIFRSIGSGLGGLPILIITSLCYTKVLDSAGIPMTSPNGQAITEMNYTIVIIGVVVMALVSILAFFACYKGSTERVILPPTDSMEKGQFIKIVKILGKNRSFMALSFAGMLLLAGQMFTQSFNQYLFVDYFGKPIMNMLYMVCVYGPMVVLIPFTPKLVRMFGKKELSAYGIALAAVANILMYAIPISAEMWWLFLLLAFVGGVGQTFLVLQIWAMITDAIDDIEVKTGLREDGTSYAAFMFFRKLGQLICAVVVNVSLIVMHYDPNPGALQSAENLAVMYDMATLIPAILFTLMALALFFWYPLNKKKTEELQVLKAETFQKRVDAGLAFTDDDIEIAIHHDDKK